jgi:hypothetical protein
MTGPKVSSWEDPLTGKETTEGLEEQCERREMMMEITTIMEDMSKGGF